MKSCAMRARLFWAGKLRTGRPRVSAAVSGSGKAPHRHHGCDVPCGSPRCWSHAGRRPANRAVWPELPHADPPGQRVRPDAICPRSPKPPARPSPAPKSARRRGAHGPKSSVCPCRSSVKSGVIPPARKRRSQCESSPAPSTVRGGGGAGTRTEVALAFATGFATADARGSGFDLVEDMAEDFGRGAAAGAGRLRPASGVTLAASLAQAAASSVVRPRGGIIAY